MKKNESASTVNRINLCPAEFQNKAERVSAGNFRNSDENFFNIEISDVIIENKVITHSALNYSKFSNAVFSGVDFDGADFKFTELENVVFSRCNMERCSFDFSVMNNVKFENCILNRSSFDYAAGDVVFNHTSMEGAEFHHVSLNMQMSECSGEGIEICHCPELNINAESCDFHRSEFINSVYHGKMTKCIFYGTDFSASNGEDLIFSECTMRNIKKNSAVGINDINVEDDDDFDLDFDINELKKII